MNKAAMDICMQVFVWAYVSSPLDEYQGMLLKALAFCWKSRNYFYFLLGSRAQISVCHWPVCL